MSFLLLVAAISITLLVFTWLLKVMRVTITTAITIAAIVLLMQLLFGIGPTQLWQAVIQIPTQLWQLMTGGR